MPNGLDLDREYGGHDYGDDHSHTCDCKHGCGCSMGPSMSHGPLGLDPAGECPGNPKDGIHHSLNDDYHTVVKRRIRNLERRAFKAEDLLKRVDPGAIELAEQLKEAQQQLRAAEQRANQAVKLLCT